MDPTTRVDAQASPAHAATTFVLSALVVVIAVSLVSFLARLVPVLGSPAYASAFTLLLLVSGLLAVGRQRIPWLRPLSAIGLVQRPSVREEAGLGAALGWGVAVLLVLPGVLALQLHSSLRLDGFHAGAMAASTLSLLLFVLVRQLVFCGLPFRSLSQATSPLFASIAFAFVAAVLAVVSDHGDGRQAFVAGVTQLLFCTAAARTRAIWLGGALQFAWAWCVTLLFGLFSFLWPSGIGVVSSSMFGARWATGSSLGPEASLWGAAVVLAALPVLWRLTRDYAWHYTYDPIVGAGYAMDVAPPAEHTRMEQQAASRPAPLVQIGGLGAAGQGKAPVSEEQ